MNRIFKKVWNRHRGCFVAVSEAMTAGQRAGKAAGIVIAAVLVGAGGLFGNAGQAAVVIDGDVFNMDPRIPQKQNSINFISADTTINGNYTYDLTATNSSSKNDLFIGAVSDNEKFWNVNLIVNGTTTFGAGTWVSIGHVGNGGGDNISASLTTNNLNVSGYLYLGSRAVKYQHSPLTSRLVVTGTMNLYSGASFFNTGHKSDGTLGTNVNTSGSGSFDIGTLNSWGEFNLASTNMPVVGEVGQLNVHAGLFQQNETNNIYVRNGLVLNGGSLVTQESLVVGERTGNFSIGNSLTLGGGSLNQTSLLTQKAGSVSVTAGNYSFDTFNKTNGTLSNAGTLAITNLNQTAGSTSNSDTLSVGNANLYGSLTSTGTLNLTGNVTTRGNLSSSGTLNNQGTWTEANAYTISGKLNNTGSVNFQNGFSFASNGKLNSSGTIQTNNVLNIFNSVGNSGSQELKYVSLNASAPQAVRTSLNNFFKKYLPGTVSQTLAQHASFTGGKVVVTGVNLTTTQRDDLVKAFKAQFFLLGRFH